MKIRVEEEYDYLDAIIQDIHTHIIIHTEAGKLPSLIMDKPISLNSL
jgi:hypothetical protein